MDIPAKINEIGSKVILELQKLLYKLKESPETWNIKCTALLLKISIFGLFPLILVFIFRFFSRFG